MKMQGEWVCLQMTWTIDGVVETARPKIILVIKADLVKYVLTDSWGKGLGEGTVTLNTTRKPRGFDLFDLEGDKGLGLRGIYRLQGDTMTIALSSKGDDYPPDFRPREGQGILVFKQTKR
jgi:uncharacterized protein (TIGR03067 family)